MMGGIFELSLGIQTALGAGYLAYTTAYAGLRDRHVSHDSVFITFAFASLGLLVFQLALPAGEIVAFASTLFVTVFSGILWRTCARSAWHWFMRTARVHREDGVHAAWSSIVQADRKVGQISVHTKDGRVLFLNDRNLFDDAPWGGLYLGGDGSVVMAVEEEELADGTEEVRTGITDATWGTRMTYVPASDILRVNIRLK